MTTTIRPVRLNHMNLVLEDYAASVAHMQSLYGAELMVEFPQKEWQACLVDIGRGIIELFVPYDFLVTARYGPHHVGVEYQADMDTVRAAIAERGIRIIRDIGLALHTHPADCFGIAFEFYDGSFHERHWDLLGGTIKPASYWSDEHPLGITGLKGYSLAARDAAAAGAFLESFVGAQLLYEAPRPGIAATARVYQVADGEVEVLSADDTGPLADHLRHFGDGIYATQYAVRDLEQARAYFAAKGLSPVPGSALDSVAIPEAANRGVVFEFGLWDRR
jgi:hypothetical protein